MIDPERALPGRDQAIAVPERHFVLGNPIAPPFPEGLEQAVFGMGCFWGAERMFWQADGVWTTAVGYAGGFTPNPTYEEVCSGSTGHTEAVLAVFDPAKTSYEEMLRIFWEGHDPTQGMRQGNDVGTQYRSAIYWHSEAQRLAAEESRAMYEARLSAAGYGEITTEIARGGPLLLRRGVPPAVPGQEPERLLRRSAAPASAARSAWRPAASRSADLRRRAARARRRSPRAPRPGCRTRAWRSSCARAACRPGRSARSRRGTPGAGRGCRAHASRPGRSRDTQMTFSSEPFSSSM